ncbi:prolyl oligopeptidase family serine peptidase [Undibacterium sp. FT147W]|uniref:Prolyl oligopeptidase family serine peptidase n=1 Tax=Undibacterium rivi TaxID=2828729 RepID=A0ABS5H197_9BURK|nr:prolyl oligopeptidase family serine peptidase [Undibacterium rivi]MBR7792465.1 prolyl oligopeptidase family serine peptidase [Undibacterium rivi]
MPEFRSSCLWLLLSAFLSGMVQAQTWGAYPQMPPAVVQAVQSVRDNASSATPDPFRLFEQTDHVQIKDWLQRQNALTDSVIARLDGRDALLARLRGGMLSDVPPAQPTGASPMIENIETTDSLIYVQTGADQHRRVIIQGKTVGAERVLFLTADNQKIRRLLPAPDMSKLGVLTQTDSNGRTELHLSVVDISEGRLLDECITLADAAESNAFWKIDSKAVFYTRYADAYNSDTKQRKTEIAQHIIGEPVRVDKVIVGAGMAKPVRLSSDDTVRMRIVTNASLVFVEVTHANSKAKSYFYAKQSDVNGVATAWKLFAAPADKIDSMEFSGDAIYLLSRKKTANGSLLKVDLKTLKLSQAKPLVNDGAAILHELFAVKDAVYWHASEAGVSQLLKADTKSGNISAIVLPLQGQVSEISLEPASGQLAFVLQSASVAPARYRLGKDGQLVPVMPAGTAVQSTSGVLSKTFYLPAANRERIPLTLIYHAGLEMDGSHPVLLVTDYMTPPLFAPGFDASRMAWLEQGGIVAIAQMRSATSELDRKAARLVKYNAADSKNDPSAKVILAAEYLIKEAYTSPEKLAAEELDSAKDAVIKAALRRPDLFAAVHVHNVRSEALPAADENNTPKKNRATAADAVFAFDELRSGVAYPAMLISADATDTTAPLWMSAKLAAGMQILSANKNRPVLLRTSAKRSDAETQSERADAWAFLLWQAGVKKFSLTGAK